MNSPLSTLINIEHMDLCSRCAGARGARTSHSSELSELAIGVWRGRCADCGQRGSSGGDAGIARFRLVDGEGDNLPETLIG
jgi:hypothetical protein